MSDAKKKGKSGEKKEVVAPAKSAAASADATEWKSKRSSGTHGVKRAAASAVEAEEVEVVEEDEGAGKDEKEATPTAAKADAMQQTEEDSEQPGAALPSPKKKQKSKATSKSEEAKESKEEEPEPEAEEAEASSEKPAKMPATAESKKSSSKAKEKPKKEGKSKEGEPSEKAAKGKPAAASSAAPAVPVGKAKRDQLASISAKENRSGVWMWHCHWKNGSESWEGADLFTAANPKLQQICHAFEIKNAPKVPVEGEEEVEEIPELEEDMYYPERIVGQRWNHSRHRTEYRMQWWQPPEVLGDNPPEQTWEPEEHLDNCQELLQKFIDSKRATEAAAAGDEAEATSADEEKQQPEETKAEGEGEGEEQEQEKVVPKDKKKHTGRIGKK